VKVPTAANCCVAPALHVGVVGETDKLASVPVPTVRVVVPLTPDAEAVIVTNPPFFPCAIPLERTEAIFGFDNSAALVRSLIRGMEWNTSRGCRVKSLTPHHRFVIALHSPDGVSETGPLVGRLEKKARKLAYGVEWNTFSGPV
jgi:hypothetical protein